MVVFISLLPRYFVPPPYSFSSSQLGFTYIGPLIGNFIGMYVCGYLNDVLSQFSARRNHGVFELEMRLPVMVIPAVLGPAGLIMFGVGVARQTHWIVPLIGNSLVGVALTGLPSFVQPYLMDSYYPVSSDALIMSIIPSLLLITSHLFPRISPHYTQRKPAHPHKFLLR